MKRRVLEVLLLLVFVAVVAVGARCYAARSPSIVGTWETQGKTHDFQLTFTEDGRLLLNFEIMNAEGEYKITSSPHEADVFFLDCNISKGNPAILKFETADTILFQEANDGEPRPTTFDDRAHRLHRVPESPPKTTSSRLVGAWEGLLEDEKIQYNFVPGGFLVTGKNSAPVIYKIVDSKDPDVCDLYVLVGSDRTPVRTALIKFETDDCIAWRGVPMVGPGPTLSDEVDFTLHRVPK